MQRPMGETLWRHSVKVTSNKDADDYRDGPTEKSAWGEKSARTARHKDPRCQASKWAS